MSHITTARSPASTMPRRALALFAVMSGLAACGTDDSSGPAGAGTGRARVVITIDPRTARDTVGTIDLTIVARRFGSATGPALLERTGIRLPIAGDTIALDVPLAACLRDSTVARRVSGDERRRCELFVEAVRRRAGVVRDREAVWMGTAVVDTTLRGPDPLRLSAQLRVDASVTDPPVAVDSVIVARAGGFTDVTPIVRDSATGDRLWLRPVTFSSVGSAFTFQNFGSTAVLTGGPTLGRGTLTMTSIGVVRTVPVVVVPRRARITAELVGEGSGQASITGGPPCVRPLGRAEATVCSIVVDEGTRVTIDAAAGADSRVRGVRWFASPVGLCMPDQVPCTFISGDASIVGTITLDPLETRFEIVLRGDGAGRVTITPIGGTPLLTCEQQVGVPPAPCVVRVPYRRGLAVAATPAPGSRWSGFEPFCPREVTLTECPLSTTAQTVLTSGFVREP